jgi:hypothetical protein
MENLNRIISEKELSSPVQLCNKQGNLNFEATGRSGIPFTECNLSILPLRNKRWNYWAVTTPDFLFSITISFIDYLGMVFAYFLDFICKKYMEKTISPPLGRGCNMPSVVDEGVTFDDNRLSAAFSVAGNHTELKGSSPDFGGSELNADIQITYPSGHQTMSAVIPWTKSYFQYKSKHNCRSATGLIKIGSSNYIMKEILLLLARTLAVVSGLFLLLELVIFFWKE